MSTDTPRRHYARVSIIAVATTLGAALGAGALAPTAGHAAAPAGPDIAATAAFDKATYTTVGQNVTATFTLRNIGTADATNVHVTGGDNGGIDISNFPTVNFDIAAGATKTFTVTGAVNAQGKSNGLVFVSNQFEPDETDVNPDNNIGTARAEVVGATGSLTGLVFHEADNDPSTVDDKGIAGVVIELYRTDKPKTLVAKVTTDAKGVFTATELPVGAYSFTVNPPAGWKLGGYHETSGAQVTENEGERILISVVPAPIASPPANAPQLPKTGSPAALIAGIGAGAVIAGAIAIGLARRRRHA